MLNLIYLRHLTYPFVYWGVSYKVFIIFAVMHFMIRESNLNWSLSKVSFLGYLALFKVISFVFLFFLFNSAGGFLDLPVTVWFKTNNLTLTYFMNIDLSKVVSEYWIASWCCITSLWNPYCYFILALLSSIIIVFNVLCIFNASWIVFG